MAPDIIQRGGEQIHFDVEIYHTSTFDHISGEVLQDVLSRGWVSASAINIWVR